MAAGVVFVRDVTRDELGNPIPVLPAGWEAYHDNHHFAVLRRLSDGAYLFCYVAADGAQLDPPQPNRAVFFAVDPSGDLKPVLKALVTNSVQAWTVRQLRLDNSMLATKVKAAIKDRRPLDAEGSPIGVKDTLHVTVAGYDLPTALEETIDLTDLDGD